MDLKDLVSVAGKGGLFKVVKPSRNGLIIESVDEKKTRSSITASQRPSILKEISIYTNDAQKSVPLSDLFIKMKTEFDPMPVDTKSSTAELMDFMSQLLPDYDQEKVYPSDVKKIINWYQIIQNHLPEVIGSLLNPPIETVEEPITQEKNTTDPNQKEKEEELFITSEKEQKGSPIKKDTNAIKEVSELEEKPVKSTSTKNQTEEKVKEEEGINPVKSTPKKKPAKEKKEVNSKEENKTPKPPKKKEK